MFNQDDYATLEQLRCDLVDLWTFAIESELGISRRDFGSHRVVLILPDVRPRGSLYAVAVEALLRGCGFGSLLVQSEAVCAAFGAGLSTATVVNLGAQTSTVACVDEGSVLPVTRIDLKFGGDDLARVLVWELLAKSFPYREINSGLPWDNQLVQSLAEMMLTLSEVRSERKSSPHPTLNKKLPPNLRRTWRRACTTFLCARPARRRASTASRSLTSR